MAVRGWAWSIAAATGAAACAGAAQLGIGYGLGIVAWRPVTDPASQAVWLTSLTWTTWVAASATVLGAVYAARPPARTDRPPAGAAGAAGTGTARTGRTAARTAGPADPAGGAADPPVYPGVWRLALAIAAAVGAAGTVALVSVPAQGALRADTFSPQTIAGGYAVLGIMLGIVLAAWALASRPAAANVVATAGWLGLLAVVAAAFRIWSRQPPYSPQPGFWRMTADTDRFWLGTIYWPAAALALTAALLIGILAALPAARRGANRLGVALSGAAGPLLAAAAHFVAAPRLAGVRGEQTSAYLIAPYAVLAGLAGSVLVAVLAQRRRRRDSSGAPAGAGPDSFRDLATDRQQDRTAAADPGGPGRPGSAPDGSPASDAPRAAGGGVARPDDRPAARPTPSADQPVTDRGGRAGGLAPTGPASTDPAAGAARGQAAVVTPPAGEPRPAGRGADRRPGRN